MPEVTLRHRLRVAKIDIRARVVNQAIHAFSRACFRAPGRRPRTF